MMVRYLRALRADPDKILWTGQRAPFDDIWRDTPPRQPKPGDATDE